jgi:hypothetical protein
MIMTEREISLIRAGLRCAGAEARREARSRKWTGPQFTEARASFRALADEYNRLADRIGAPDVTALARTFSGPISEALDVARHSDDEPGDGDVSYLARMLAELALR